MGIANPRFVHQVRVFSFLRRYVGDRAERRDDGARRSREAETMRDDDGDDRHDGRDARDAEDGRRDDARRDEGRHHRDGDDRARRERPDVNDLVSVKIDNLSYDAREEYLREAFSRYGEIGDVYVPLDRETRRPRGFCFVRYASKADAEAAVSGMHEIDFMGRQIRCSIA